MALYCLAFLAYAAKANVSPEQFILSIAWSERILRKHPDLLKASIMEALSGHDGNNEAYRHAAILNGWSSSPGRKLVRSSHSGRTSKYEACSMAEQALSLDQRDVSMDSLVGQFIHHAALDLARLSHASSKRHGESDAQSCELTLQLAESKLGASLVDWAKACGSTKPMANFLLESFTDPNQLSCALAIAIEQKALDSTAWSGPWKGPHPLRILAGPRSVDGGWRGAMRLLTQAGYGADWSLPAGFEGAAHNPASSTEPNFLLQWIKSNEHCLEEAVRVSIASKIDFNERNARGETALGALNRRARIMHISPDAQSALKLACEHGDPLDLSGSKTAMQAAATPAIAALVKSETERRALEEGIDGALWAECLAKAQAEMNPPDDPARNRSRL